MIIIMDKTKLSNSTVPGGIVRMTRQRRVILEEMQVPGRHFTADMVYERVRRRLPNISLGTVYRNLEILSRVGRIKKLHLCGRKLYDGGLHRHYHVRCVKCGRICDVPAEPFGDIEVTAKGNSDFEILDHQLEFDGICPECQNTCNTE